MDVTIILSNGDPEIKWNTFRLANLMLNELDEVTIFLNGPAVDYTKGDCEDYPLSTLAKTFVLSEGTLFG